MFNFNPAYIEINNWLFSFLCITMACPTSVPCCCDFGLISSDFCCFAAVVLVCFIALELLWSWTAPHLVNYYYYYYYHYYYYYYYYSSYYYCYRIFTTPSCACWQNAAFSIFLQFLFLYLDYCHCHDHYHHIILLMFFVYCCHCWCYHYFSKLFSMSVKQNSSPARVSMGLLQQSSWHCLLSQVSELIKR